MARYTALVVLMATPVAEVLWLLPLPFIVLCLKTTLQYVCST